jgi:hypothetical protein
VIPNVAVADAVELSHRLDGIALSQPTGSANADITGRVIYAAPNNGLVEVHIYIAHR